MPLPLHLSHLLARSGDRDSHNGWTSFRGSRQELSAAITSVTTPLSEVKTGTGLGAGVTLIVTLQGGDVPGTFRAVVVIEVDPESSTGSPFAGGSASVKVGDDPRRDFPPLHVGSNFITVAVVPGETILVTGEKDYSRTTPSPSSPYGSYAPPEILGGLGPLKIRVVTPKDPDDERRLKERRSSSATPIYWRTTV
jgi:hypothetical protein